MSCLSSDTECIYCHFLKLIIPLKCTYQDVPVKGVNIVSEWTTSCLCPVGVKKYRVPA